MPVSSKTLSLHTQREGEILDITDKVQSIIANGKITNGVAFLFIPGSTAALTTMEYEPGLVSDLLKTLERIAPKSAQYAHEEQWHDGNGHSHIKAAIIGPDLFVPVKDGHLVLGTWQQIVFIELDTRPRNRTVIIQLVGE